MDDILIIDVEKYDEKNSGHAIMENASTKYDTKGEANSAERC